MIRVGYYSYFHSLVHHSSTFANMNDLFTQATMCMGTYLHIHAHIHVQTPGTGTAAGGSVGDAGGPPSAEEATARPAARPVFPQSFLPFPARHHKSCRPDSDEQTNKKLTMKKVATLFLSA